jgi:hypothetical protein
MSSLPGENEREATAQIEQCLGMIHERCDRLRAEGYSQDVILAALNLHTGHETALFMKFWQGREEDPVAILDELLRRVRLNTLDQFAALGGEGEGDANLTEGGQG